jgi:hypothetical protein
LGVRKAETGIELYEAKFNSETNLTYSMNAICIRCPARTDSVRAARGPASIECVKAREQALPNLYLADHLVMEGAGVGAQLKRNVEERFSPDIGLCIYHKIPVYLASY